MKRGHAHTVVLIRHGESTWNHSKRFSGWVDVDLTEKGNQQALLAGAKLKAAGLQFDEAHSSLLKRSVRTLWNVLHVSNQHYVQTHLTWRLNERHYGALTGLSKDDAKHKFGEDMLQHYRRGYNVQPPTMTEGHPFYEHIYHDKRYEGEDHAVLPRGESLGMCLARVVPYWENAIAPSVLQGRKVIVAAHNNVIRCLIHHLDGIQEDELERLEIPTGAPLLYHLDEQLQPTRSPDDRGFRGEFLEISDEELTAAQHDPLAAPISIDYISNDELLAERQRLLGAAEASRSEAA